jgi:hypothetical protein
MKNNWTALLIGLILIGSAGGVHGLWTQRWTAASESIDPQHVLNFETTISGWKPEEFQEVRPIDMPEKTKMVSRVFRNRTEKAGAVVSITSGHPGIVAVHTPDLCYLGSGYKLRTAVKKETVELITGDSAEFYVAEFSKNTTLGLEVIRVRWTWTSDGKWQAPDYPRWLFGRATQLHKVYIVQPVSSHDRLTADEGFRNFVAALMPELSRHLN